MPAQGLFGNRPALASHLAASACGHHIPTCAGITFLLTHQNSSQPDRLLDVHEVAQITGTTERFARRLVSERRIATVKVGKFVRVRSSDLDAWIVANTRPAGGES